MGTSTGMPTLVLGCLFFLNSLASGAEKTAGANASRPAVAATVEQHTETPRTVYLNFKNADLLQIINLMSELMGKNFIVDEKVRGKVTIVAPEPVSLEEAYQVFLSILEIQGYTIVSQGPVNKIIPTQEVKERPVPTAINGRLLPTVSSDEFVTQLIPLQSAKATELHALLAPLVSRQSSLLVYPPTNTLILTERRSNVSRLLKVIEFLDIKAPPQVLKIIHLTHASAEKLALALQAALEGFGQDGQQRVPSPSPATAGGAGPQGPSSPVKIVPDPRTNSLIVVANERTLALIENMIFDLDIPTPQEQSQVHVYYLAHANAEELAKILNAQANEMVRMLQQGAAKDETPPTPPQAAGAGASLGTLVTITPDKATNSLAITAPPEIYAMLRELIVKLDIRRSQVLVESLIVEITLDEAQALGVEWRLIDEPNGSQVFGSSLGTGQTGLLNPLSGNPLASPGGLVLGFIRNSFTFNGQEIFNIPTLLRAFQSHTDVNILATPNLLTTDNEEAEIVIGEERPFLQATTETPAGGVLSTTRTFEFRDTGIILRLTPQISQGRTVRLKLFQEVTNFVSETETGAVTTTKRSAKTTVIVDDGQTIVVGGLIQEDNNDAKTQVPCLGNLPVFGWAFRQTSSKKSKTNLLIFITPHIIASPEDAGRITDHRIQESEKAEEIRDRLQKGRPQQNLERLVN